jgi:hypothetical protein
MLAKVMPNGGASPPACANVMGAGDGNRAGHALARAVMHDLSCPAEACR